MQIKVIQDDGVSETITLTGEWRVQEGEKLNRLIGPHGFTHFFTHSGEYDGWGSGVFEPMQNRCGFGHARAELALGSPALIGNLTIRNVTHRSIRFYVNNSERL